jgi:hypothetical protein
LVFLSNPVEGNEVKLERGNEVKPEQGSAEKPAKKKPKEVGGTLPIPPSVEPPQAVPGWPSKCLEQDHSPQPLNGFGILLKALDYQAPWHLLEAMPQPDGAGQSLHQAGQPKPETCHNYSALPHCSEKAEELAGSSFLLDQIAQGGHRRPPSSPELPNLAVSKLPHVPGEPRLVPLVPG